MIDASKKLSIAVNALLYTVCKELRINKLVSYLNKFLNNL